jgi:hypothetical protein
MEKLFWFREKKTLNPESQPGEIADPGGIPERGFHWNWLPDYSGKRGSEKILWMDDDLGM